MFSKRVHKWNSVDISNGNNAILHTRGIVVDKTETGLIVDFGIANKEPELIAFDRIIQDDEPASPLTCACGFKDFVNHQVLLQLSLEQPWTWYPVEQLAGPRTAFVLVTAAGSDGRRITDVVRTAQLRCCAKPKMAVRFSDYLKEYVNVPYDDFVVTPSFRKLWTERIDLARTCPIGIVNKQFYYIQRRHDEGLEPSTVINHIDEIMRESTMNDRGLKRSHEESENEDTMHHNIHTKTELGISDIPYDVLHEVLSHIDTVQLVRYRRVCPLWDSVITSMDLTTVVTCDISTYKNKDAYVLAAVLFKFITKSTTHLIFTRRTSGLMEMNSWIWFRRFVEITKAILDETGITVPTLVMSDLRIDSSDLLELSHSSKDGATAVSESLRSIFQRLVLLRVTLLDIFKDDDPVRTYYTAYRNLEILYATIKTVSSTKWEIRDALEPSVQEVMKSEALVEYDLELLSDWINKTNEDVVENGIAELLRRMKIMQALQTWEADDPRFGPTCSWNDLEAAQLGNKLDTLHSLTVMCLLYRMKQYDRFKEDYCDESDSNHSMDSSGSSCPLEWKSFI